MTAGPRYRLFGDVRLSRRDGTVIPLAPVPARLLTALLVDRNRPVSTGDLTDRLWNDTDGPADRTAALYTAVSRLRRALDADDPLIASALETTRGGYLLRVDPAMCDADLIARHLQACRRSLAVADRARASAELEAARSYRSGPPLGSGPVEAWAHVTAVELAALDTAIAELTDRVGSLICRPAPGTLIERDMELAELSALVTPGRPGVVLLGPAGVGKSALATALAAAASPAAATVTVRAREATENTPLAPFLPLLDDADDRTMSSGLPPAVRSTLRARAAGRPLLVFVDDAAHLDPASAALLDDLADDPSVTLLVTARSGARLPATLSRRVHLGDLPVRTVAPLDETATAALAHALLGRPLDSDLRRRLFRLSSGNPLHVRIIVESGLDSATTAQSLAEFVDAELAGLADTARTALAVIALGEPLPVSVAEHVAPPETLQSLESQGLIMAHRDGTEDLLCVTHPLYGEVLRDHTSPLMIRSAFRSLVSAAGHAPGVVEPIRVADWSSRCGAALGSELALSAAEQAAAGGDHALADRFARMSWTTTPSPEAALLSAVASFAARPGTEVLDHLDLLIAHADPAGRVQLEFGRALTMFWKLADAAGAFAALDDMDRQYRDASGESTDTIRAARAALTAHLPDPEAALRLSDPLVGRRDPLVGDNALMAATMAHAMLGHADDALDLLARPGITERVDQTPTLRLLRIPPMIQLGILADAEAELDAVEHAGGQSSDHRAESWLRLYRADVLQWTGQVEPALDTALRAVALFNASGHPVEERIALIRAAYCAACVGDDEVDTLLTRADRIPPVGRYREGDRHRAMAVRSGTDTDAGRRHLRDAVRVSRDSGQRFDEVCALADLVRLGAHDDEVRRLASLGAAVGGLASTLADDALASLHRDAGALSSVAQRFAMAGVLGHAARAGNEAAQAHRSTGDRRAAAFWSDRAAGWAGTADVTGLLVDALTPREREITDLAVSGHRSRDIAQRLHLSVRTVDNHLQRIYDKAGVRGRDRLAELVRPIQP